MAVLTNLNDISTSRDFVANAVAGDLNEIMSNSCCRAEFMSFLNVGNADFDLSGGDWRVELSSNGCFFPGRIFGHYGIERRSLRLGIHPLSDSSVGFGLAVRASLWGPKRGGAAVIMIKRYGGAPWPRRKRGCFAVERSWWQRNLRIEIGAVQRTFCHPGAEIPLRATWHCSRVWINELALTGRLHWQRESGGRGWRYTTWIDSEPGRWAFG